MTPEVIVVGVAVLYLVACLAIGMWPSRKASASADGFVAGDRSMGLLVTYFITGATIFSSFAFLGMPGWAYSRGVAAFYVLGYGTIGLLPLYFLGPRAARVGQRYGFVTQAEMVARRFERPGIAGLMSFITVLALVPYLAIQMKGAGLVFNVMTEGALSEEAGAAIVYGVVLLYVLKSGVLGVGWTNTFQGSFMMVLAWTLGILIPIQLYGGVGEMFARIQSERPELLKAPGLAGSGEPWSWGDYVSAVVVSCIGFTMWPQLFMRSFSASSEQTLRTTVVLYPTFQLFLVPIMILGFAGVLLPEGPDKPDQILPHLLLNSDLSPFVIGLFCAGALAASMSSGDAFLHTSASSIVRDGWRTALSKDLEPQRERAWIRFWILVVAILAYVTAVLYRGSLVDLLLIAYGPVTQFAPAVVATLYSKRATARGVFAGMAIGIAVNMLLHFRPELRPLGMHAGICGLIANVAVLVIVSWTDRSARPEGDVEFLRVAATPSSSSGSREQR